MPVRRCYPEWCNCPGVLNLYLGVSALLEQQPDHNPPSQAVGVLLQWDRERVRCESLQKVECLGSWLREGHFKHTTRGGMGLVTDTSIDSGDNEASEDGFD